MIALQVEYLTGPNAGRKLLLRDTTVTFGRSSERTLPLDLQFASREHGEFNFANGQWQLTNLSNNGTRLNGKNVTTKPRPIKGTCTITIGGDDVFRVTPIADEADITTADDAKTATPDNADETEQAASANNSKAKLWIGIGVFWLITFGFIAFATLNSGGSSDASATAGLPAPITAERIQQIIARPIDKAIPDERQADQALAQAREFYALIDRRPDALFRSYDSYRLALSYTPGDSFPDAKDQRQFYVLQKRLTEAVTTQYQSASALLLSKQYNAADEAFKDLREAYPDTNSPIFTDAMKREAAARNATR